MLSSLALARKNLVAHDNAHKDNAQLSESTARRIASSWIDAITIENAFVEMGAMAIAWRAVPPAQNVFASICSDMIEDNARISCCGFQAHGWMTAAGASMVDVMRVQLGKILPTNVIASSAEDIAANMKKGQMQIVALHIENAAGWNDVRQISAAAVKAEAAMLMMISAAVPAPEGVAIDIINDWTAIAHATRDAFAAVRDNGAIRLVAMNDDVTVSALDMAVMNAAQMNGTTFATAIAANDDNAEKAMNAAYQSAVTSF
jgi:hypothetical protein